MLFRSCIWTDNRVKAWIADRQAAYRGGGLQRYVQDSTLLKVELRGLGETIVEQFVANGPCFGTMSGANIPQSAVNPRRTHEGGLLRMRSCVYFGYDLEDALPCVAD